VDVGAELAAGLSPAGTPEGCCSLGSSAIDLSNLRLRTLFCELRR